MIKIQNKNQKGFTIIEALVSISIILILLVGPLTLVFNGINSIKQEKNRIIATNLGEEIVENLRAYRDSFNLACKQIDYQYSGDAISSAKCNYNGSNLNISSDILLNNQSQNPRKIAWDLFLSKINSSTTVYLDKNSFNFGDLSDNINECGDSFIYFSSLYGYTCTSSNAENTSFKRQIKFTKISGNILKIEVEVFYAKSKIFLGGSKSIKITDYIYER